MIVAVNYLCTQNNGSILKIESEKVIKNFPEKNPPTQHQLESSDYYIHRSIRDRVLRNMGFNKE